MVITFYAGLLGLFYVFLSLNVVRGRFKNRISLGDSGNEDMLKRIRIHGNFMEYTPIALILIFFAEWQGAPAILIHILGTALFLGRLMHPVGILLKDGASIGRTGGMILTLSVILIAAFTCVFGSYFSGR